VSDLFTHGDAGLSLYPMPYTSSKGEVMRIDDTEKMHDFRLVAVYNKMQAQDERGGAVGQLLEAVYAEIVRRGLDPRFKGGRPPLTEPPLDEGFA
jgi:hypothetical protein